MLGLVLLLLESIRRFFLQQTVRKKRKIQVARTLSKPAIFLFSAKNSAGLFCCRTSAFPAMSSAYLMDADVHPSIVYLIAVLTAQLVIKATDDSNQKTSWRALHVEKHKGTHYAHFAGSERKRRRTQQVTCPACYDVSTCTMHISLLCFPDAFSTALQSRLYSHYTPLQAREWQVLIIYHDPAGHWCCLYWRELSHRELTLTCTPVRGALLFRRTMGVRVPGV